MGLDLSTGARIQDYLIFLWSLKLAWWCLTTDSRPPVRLSHLHSTAHRSIRFSCAFVRLVRLAVKLSFIFHQYLVPAIPPCQTQWPSREGGATMGVAFSSNRPSTWLPHCLGLPLSGPGVPFSWSQLHTGLVCGSDLRPHRLSSHQCRLPTVGIIYVTYKT